MELFLAAAIVSGTPLLFATVGELITEKAGNLNLGVEGMMLMGACIGFLVGLSTGNPLLALAGAALAGGGGALIYAVITVTLRANQIVTGLTLTIFGTGFSRFVGQDMVGAVIPVELRTSFAKMNLPLLSDIPFFGPVFFRQDAFVYLGYVVAILAAIYLYRTRTGLNMRAVGENSAAADASGIPISLYKYVHIILGGALCGLGGAYLSLVIVPIWQVDVVGGRGWIAVALVIFASWNPIKALFAAFLFGGLGILGLRLQSMGVHVSQYLVDMIPYLATILIVIISTMRNRKEGMPPAGLGSAYFREER
jgi:simple sugar transport system permease protein